MLKIRKYLKPYILLAIISPLLMIGEVVGDLLLPYLMSYIVNYGITGMDINDPVTGSLVTRMTNDITQVMDFIEQFVGIAT